MVCLIKGLQVCQCIVKIWCLMQWTFATVEICVVCVGAKYMFLDLAKIVCTIGTNFTFICLTCCVGVHVADQSGPVGERSWTLMTGIDCV